MQVFQHIPSTPRNGLQNIVKEALQERDFSDDTAVSAKAAKIVRRDMFSHKGFSFSGTFPLGCQEISLPASLKSGIPYHDNEWSECKGSRK